MGKGIKCWTKYYQTSPTPNFGLLKKKKKNTMKSNFIMTTIFIMLINILF